MADNGPEPAIVEPATAVPAVATVQPTAGVNGAAPSPAVAESRVANSRVWVTYAKSSDIDRPLSGVQKTILEHHENYLFQPLHRDRTYVRYLLLEHGRWINRKVFNKYDDIVVVLMKLTHEDVSAYISSVESVEPDPALTGVAYSIGGIHTCARLLVLAEVTVSLDDSLASSYLRKQATTLAGGAGALCAPKKLLRSDHAVLLEALEQSLPYLLDQRNALRSKEEKIVDVLDPPEEAPMGSRRGRGRRRSEGTKGTPADATTPGEGTRKRKRSTDAGGKPKRARRLSRRTVLLPTPSLPALPTPSAPRSVPAAKPSSARKATVSGKASASARTPASKRASVSAVSSVKSSASATKTPTSKPTGRKSARFSVKHHATPTSVRKQLNRPTQQVVWEQWSPTRVVPTTVSREEAVAIERQHAITQRDVFTEMQTTEARKENGVRFTKFNDSATTTGKIFVGEGSFGEVWGDEGTGMVTKLMRNGKPGQDIKEAFCLWALAGAANVVPLLGVIHEQQQESVVIKGLEMPRLSYPLQSFFKKYKTQVTDSVHLIVKQICTGILAAHDLGIAHMDLSAENICVQVHDDNLGMISAVVRSPRRTPRPAGATTAQEVPADSTTRDVLSDTTSPVPAVGANLTATSSPAKSPAELSAKSPAKPPAKSPAELSAKSPAKSPAKPPAKSPAKLSPAKLSPAKPPAKSSPARSPAKSSPAKYPKSSPAKADSGAVRSTGGGVSALHMTKHELITFLEEKGIPWAAPADLDHLRDLVQASINSERIATVPDVEEIRVEELIFVDDIRDFFKEDVGDEFIAASDPNEAVVWEFADPPYNGVDENSDSDFDSREDVQSILNVSALLIDFGTARFFKGSYVQVFTPPEFLPQESDGTGLIRTRTAGHSLYRPPELLFQEEKSVTVVLVDPTKVDVYSFAIVMWEALYQGSLKPFAGYIDQKDRFRDIKKNNMRPDIHKMNEMRMYRWLEMLHSLWNANPNERWSMKESLDYLEEHEEALRRENRRLARHLWRRGR